METIIKMLNVLAWITVIWSSGVFIFKCLTYYLYQGSLEQLKDKIEGVKRDFFANLVAWTAAFIVSLVYLIVK